MRTRTRLLALAAVLALAAAACGDDGEERVAGGAPVQLPGTVNDEGTRDLSGAASLTLRQDNFSFEPTFIKATPGQRITVDLENEGDVAHTFTIDDPRVDVVVEPGATGVAAVTLPSGGVVNFYCRFHRARGMQGAFFFEEGGQAPPVGSPAGEPTPAQTAPGGGFAPY